MNSDWFVYSDLSYLATVAATTLVTTAVGSDCGPYLLFRGSAEILRTDKLKQLGNLFGSKDNFVGIDIGKLSQGEVEFKAKSIAIMGWGLQDTKVSYSWTTGEIEAETMLKLGTGGPGIPLVFGWNLSKNRITKFGAGVEITDPGIQLGVSPLYVQMLGGEVTLSPEWEVSLYTRLTVGPEVKDKAIITINAGLTLDNDSIKISTDSLIGDGGIVIFNKNFFSATGSLEYNWTQNYLKGQVNAKLLNGLAELDAVMKIWDNKGVLTTVMAGDVTVRIPKNVWLIGGWTIGSAGVGVYITANGNNHDDYILVAKSFDFFTNDGKWWKWSWKNDIGVKFYFDGKWDVIGASMKNLQELKNYAKSSRLATSAAPIDGLENPNLLVLDWGYTNENPLITFKLSDGRILTEAEMIENEYLMFVEELSSDMRRVYGVLEFSDPEIAQWEYTLDGDAAAIAPELWGQDDNLDVHANSITGGGGKPYQFDVSVFSGESDASPDTILTFYLSDGEERDFNGLPVWTTTLGELQDDGWLPPEGLAPGTYSLYVVAEYGNLVPTKAYFEETIIIEASLAPITSVITTTTQGSAVLDIHEWQQFSCELWLNEAPADQLQITLAYDANLFVPVVADEMVQHQVADGVTLTFGDAIWNSESGLTEWVVTVEIGVEFQWPGDSLLLAVIDFTPALTTDFGDIVGVSIEDVYRSGEETPWLVVNGESVLTNVWAVPYDLTDDGVVNIYDLIAFAKTYGSEKPEDIASDFTGDGGINIYDLIQFAKHYGASIKDENASITIPRIDIMSQSAMVALSDGLSQEVVAMFGTALTTETTVKGMPTELPDAEYPPVATEATDSYSSEKDQADQVSDVLAIITPEENVILGDVAVCSAFSVDEQQEPPVYAANMLVEEVVDFSQVAEVTSFMPATFPISREAVYVIHKTHTRQLPTASVANDVHRFTWTDYDSIGAHEDADVDFLVQPAYTSPRRQEIVESLFAEDDGDEELVEMETMFYQTMQQRLQRRWNG